MSSLDDSIMNYKNKNKNQCNDEDDDIKGYFMDRPYTEFEWQEVLDCTWMYPDIKKLHGLPCQYSTKRVLMTFEEYKDQRESRKNRKNN